MKYIALMDGVVTFVLVSLEFELLRYQVDVSLKVMLVKLSQEANAPPPIKVTLSGISTLVKLSQ